MEDMDLKNIWQAYDRKLEEARILNLQSWALNLQSFENLQSHKAKSVLNRLAGFKVWMVVLGFVWVFLLVFLIVHSLTLSKIFFVVSAGMIAVCTGIAVVVYIKHIVLIREIDNTDSVTAVQQKLSKLQASTINIVRILFLQSPFYTTWYINRHMLEQENTGMWIFQILVTSFFSVMAIWLYKNISYRNAHKKWFKLLFSGLDWTAPAKAMEFMKEIEEFKKELA